ncbi:MAG: PKD domain-containing protein [Acidobacteriota bacterium]
MAVPVAALVPGDNATPSARIKSGPTARLYSSDASRQAELKAQPGYQRFLARHGNAWEAQFDELLATPVYIRGEGIPLIDGWRTATKGTVEAISRRFLTDNAELLRVAENELALTDIAFYADVWVVYFEHRYQGMPVIGSRVELVYKLGRLVLLYGESYPVATLDAATHVSTDEAARIIADELVLGPSPQSSPDATRAVVFPVVERDRVIYRRAIEVTQRRPSSVESSQKWFVSYVDASNGNILEIQDRICRQFSGSVTSSVDTRTINDPIIQVPNVDEQVDVGAGAANTDGAGAWSLAGSGTQTLTTSLSGLHCRVVNKGGADMQISHAVTSGVPSNDLFAAATDLELAQTQTYRGVEATNAMVRTVYAGNAWLNSAVMPANVNLNRTCNAYWDGTAINMFRSGDGCNNTGRMFDAVAHEYGHGCDQNLPAGNLDGGLGEFIADQMSFLQTDSPLIAPYFTTSGKPVRDLDPSNYPCFDPTPTEPHDQGEMLGAVMWDIHEDLQAAGLTNQQIITLLLGPIATSQSRSAWYNGLLVADDDDGNLANGTPHGCIIWNQFDKHSCGPFRWFGVSTTPVRCTSSGAPVASFEAVPTAGAAPLSVQFTDVTAHAPTSWAWDFGDGTTSALQNPSHVYAVAGSYTVSLTATNALGSDARVEPDLVTVLDVTSIFCDNLDGGAPGWTHTGTFDEWKLSTPKGKGYIDPLVATSAPNVWGTDLGQDGNYQPTASCHLDSPAVDCTGRTGVHLLYQRWLNVMDRSTDQATIYVNGQPVWQNPSGASFNESAWACHLIDISAIADGNPNVVVRYELIADEAFELGGWTIDDFCLVTLNGPNPPVADFSGAPTSGNAPLTVAFTDLSVNVPTTWLWDFGDGTTSAAQSPSHVYAVDGDYTVRLTASNAQGSNASTRVRYVHAASCAVPAADFAPYTTSGPLTIDFGDLSTNGPTAWLWEFGDTKKSYTQNPSHLYPGPGTYTVILRATNACGSGSISKLVSVATRTEEIVSGAGTGSTNAPVVKTWDHAATPGVVDTWTAYGGTGYGVNVAGADIVSGGAYEVLTVPGPGAVYGPQVRGWQSTGTSIGKVNFYAYGTLRYGAHASGGDLDIDGHDEIFTAPGPGPVFGPHVRGWNYDGVALSPLSKVSFFAYSTLRYGARVAGGSLNLESTAEVVTGAGAGVVFAPHVRTWNYGGPPFFPLRIVAGASFFAFGTGQYGASVATGNTSIAEPSLEILVGHGPDPGADGTALGFVYQYWNDTVAFSWTVPAFASLGGVEVASGDLDGDGDEELVAGAGWGAANTSEVRAFDIAGSGGTQVLGYTAYPAQSYGTKVSVGEIGI